MAGTATTVSDVGGVRRLFHRPKGAIPYLLLAPGIAWLVVFFVVPMWYLGKMSLSQGLFPIF